LFWMVSIWRSFRPAWFLGIPLSICVGCHCKIDLFSNTWSLWSNPYHF
jgi:hypothetical protein